MKQSKTELLLYEPKLYKAFIILSLPVFIANFMKAANDFVDTYFIGHIQDSFSAQAGMSISWPLINIMMCFSVGLSVAGVAIISQHLGSGNTESARKYSGLLVSLSLVLGVAVNAIMYFIAEPSMRLLGAEGAVLEAATVYLKVRSFEMTALFIFAAFQAIRQAQGDTTTPVLLSVITVLINIVLTWYFVQELSMGVFGAALATAIGNIAMTPICLWMLFAKRASLRITLRSLVGDVKSVVLLSKLAAPSACSQALAALGFLVLQAFILDFGDRVAAAFSIGNKISNLLLIPVMALGSVLAAYVGQNIGHGNKERAKQAYRASRNIGLIFSIIGGLAIIPQREPILALLTNDAETLEIAAEYSIFVLLTQPLMALFQNYMGVYNGSGNTNYSFILASVRLWIIRLPLILILKNYTSLGRSGIWYAMLISNFIILLLGMYLYSKIDFEPKGDVQKKTAPAQSANERASVNANHL